MIGGRVLQLCLERPDVDRVTVLVRKPSGVAHPKLMELVHSDLLELSPVAERMAGQDVCFFCLGVYTGAVPPDEFRKITVDYTRSFATLLREKSPTAAFCFLSGEGADRTEKSGMMFARDKGAAENLLVALQFARLHVFRPGYIYPSQPRVEPNWTYSLMRVLYKPVMSKVYPNGGVTSDELADAMVRVGFGGGAELLTNREIRGVVKAI